MFLINAWSLSPPHVYISVPHSHDIISWRDAAESHFLHFDRPRTNRDPQTAAGHANPASKREYSLRFVFIVHNKLQSCVIRDKQAHRPDCDVFKTGESETKAEGQ